jgi:hypothetical protein
VWKLRLQRFLAAVYTHMPNAVATATFAVLIGLAGWSASCGRNHFAMIWARFELVEQHVHEGEEAMRRLESLTARVVDADRRIGEGEAFQRRCATTLYLLQVDLRQVLERLKIKPISPPPRPPPGVFDDVYDGEWAPPRLDMHPFESLDEKVLGQRARLPGDTQGGTP